MGGRLTKTGARAVRYCCRVARAATHVPHSPAEEAVNLHRRRIALIAALAGLIAVLIAVLAAGSTQRACVSCHGEQARSMAARSHAGVGCYDCHRPHGSWGAVAQKSRELGSMYPKALLGMTPTGPVAQIPRDNCLRCHETLTGDSTVGRAIRITHVECAQGGSCDECHAAVAHGDAVRWKTGYVMERCVTCHTRRGLESECATCHRGQVSRGDAPDGPWQVTHGPEWRVTHGMGDITACRTCHPKGYCARCHRVDLPHPAEFGGMHGEAAMRDRDACSVCHKGERLCDGCHQVEMPHPLAFTRQHFTNAKSTSDPTCVRCHETSDCERCHTSHIHPGGSKGVPVPWTVTDERLRSVRSR